MIIDSHVHYAHCRFNGEFPYLSRQEKGYELKSGKREQLITELRQKGIEGFIEPSIGIDDLEKQLALVRAHPDFMWWSVGNHPTRCIRTPFRKRKLILEYAEKYPPVAIGETGLDYHLSRIDQHRFRQKRWFVFQIKLAHRLQLPLILHLREADKDGLKILKKYRSKLHGGVVHCFSGGVKEAEEYVALGFALGIGGKLLKEDAQGEALAQAVRSVPLSALLVETDSPFVLPETGDLGCSTRRRKKLCNSSLILPDVIGRIALLRSEAPERVEDAIYQNTLRVFGLKKEAGSGDG